MKSSLLLQPEIPCAIVEGRLSHVEYHDAESGFAVCILAPEDRPSFRAVGNLRDTNLHSILRLEGKWQPDHTGELFQFDDYLTKPPEGGEGLVHYIETRADVPRGYCQTLVKHFGAALLRAIDTNPDQLFLAELPEDSVQKIIDTFSSRSDYERVRQELDIVGIPLYKLKELHRQLGEEIDLTSRIKEDPFLLYIWFDDLPFSDIQKIARYRQIPVGSKCEVRAACLAALRRSMIVNGHTAYPVDRIARDASAILKTVAVTPQEATDHLKSLPTAVVVVHEGVAAFPAVIDSERGIAELLRKPRDPSTLIFTTSPEMVTELAGTEASTSELISEILAQNISLTRCSSRADEDRLLTAIVKILAAHHADCTIIVAYPCQVRWLNSLLNNVAVMLPEDLFGANTYGVPDHDASSPVKGEVFIIPYVGLLQPSTMANTLTAIPVDSQIIMTGAESSGNSPVAGQLFRDIATLKAFEVLEHKGNTRIDQLPEEGLSEAPICWVQCEWDDLFQQLPSLLGSLAAAYGIDIFNDIVVTLLTPTVVNGSQTKRLNREIHAHLTKELLPQSEQITWQGSDYREGEPFLLGKPIFEPPFPAFSRCRIISCDDDQLKIASGDSTTYVDKHTPLQLLPGFAIPLRWLTPAMAKVVVCCVHPVHSRWLSKTAISRLMDTSTAQVILLGAVVPEDIATRNKISSTRMTSMSLLPEFING